MVDGATEHFERPMTTLAHDKQGFLVGELLDKQRQALDVQA